MTATLLSEKVVTERVARIRAMLAAIQCVPLESYESFLSADHHVAAAVDCGASGTDRLLVVTVGDAFHLILVVPRLDCFASLAMTVLVACPR